MAKRIRGNFNPELIQGALRQGDHNVVQMASGTPTAGHVLVYDANGNAIDGGAPSGTVTHTAGGLTADRPVFGAGSADIKVGTKTGNTDALVTSTGTATSGYPLLYDASGNAIARQPRGNTTVVQLADVTTAPTSGHLVKFDASGNTTDGGVAPQTKASTSHQFLISFDATTGLFVAAQPTEADLSLSNITTNDVSTSKHGFAPILPNDGTKFLNGLGTYAVPAGSGGGGFSWLSTTDPTSGPAFTWRNQGTATITTRTQSFYLLAPALLGDQIRGREITAPASPVSITIGIVPQVHNVVNNQVGLYVSDGTKLIVLQTQQNGLSVARWNTVTTFNSTTTSTGGFGNQYGPMVFFKVVDDGTNLAWYWSVNGLDFMLISTGLRLAFLASISFIGFYTNASNATWPAGVLLVSWTQGTS